MPHGGRGKGKGGRRVGTPGKAYPNRSDLRGPVPIQAAPNQGYGEAGAQLAAQRAVPMAAPHAPAGVGGPVPSPAPAGPAPGGLGDLLRPTERPGEPLTSGIAQGPGPGPEALGPPPGSAADPDLLPMRNYLPTLELLANQPSSSVAVRNFVRRVRGAMPSDAPGARFGETAS